MRPALLANGAEDLSPYHFFYLVLFLNKKKKKGRAEVPLGSLPTIRCTYALIGSNGVEDQTRGAALPER